MPEPILLTGDARALRLPDDSVDLVVTSPPYWSLRDYGTVDQIGGESSPGQYLANLLAVTAECVRVLKPSGSIFVNLGDKYSGSPQDQVPRKSLMLLPERYRIRCVDQLGLLARAVVIWDKPNGLPESVTDRVRRSHEDWVHLTKSHSYYSAVDEIREPYQGGQGGLETTEYGAGRHGAGRSTLRSRDTNALGKLPGSVWKIATQPLNVPAELGVDHFAAFPMEWPRRIITGWSPREVCGGCGEGRRPVVDRSEKVLRRPSGAKDLGRGMEAAGSGPAGVRSHVGNVHTVHRIIGYACACRRPDASTEPGVVLDPFGGTGTTALVASQLGRLGISIDASPDYRRIAEWRCNDPKQRLKAAGTSAPPYI